MLLVFRTERLHSAPEVDGSLALVVSALLEKSIMTYHVFFKDSVKVSIDLLIGIETNPSSNKAPAIRHCTARSHKAL